MFLMNSFFLFPLFLGFVWVGYLSNCNMFFNVVGTGAGFSDEIALFIIFMAVFVFFISFIYALPLNDLFNVNFVLISIFLFSYGVFSTDNLFVLYFCYESSLIPILYSIVKWGSYPERSIGAIILLVYTAIFSFPFIVVIFNFFSLNGSFSLTEGSLLSFNSLGTLGTFVTFCAFAVKLPIYGLHFWLPIAHVEAPTFGSMLLAGVLLNLGGVGLLRCTSLIALNILSHTILSYLIFFILYVTIVCIFQSDFKRLVAYSSVSHIMAIPILLIADNLMSTKTLVLLIFFHGLSSPILFMLVGVIYSMFSSRQFIVIRGILVISPLISFLMVLAFFFTLSAPPFPSFVSEVYFLVASLSLSPYFLYVFWGFTFLSLIYNLNWLSAIVFSSATLSNMGTSLSYLIFMPIIVSVLFCVPVSTLLYFL